MPGFNRATGRVVALIALLVLSGVALRGYLPGEERGAKAEPGNNPAALVALITLLGAAIVIITIAVVARLRQPRSPRQGGNPMDRGFGGDRNRLSWRFMLIAVAALLVWLVIVVVLMQLTRNTDLGQPSPGRAPATSAPAATATQPPAPSEAPEEDGGSVFWILLTTTIFMVLVWASGFVLALRRRRRPLVPQVVGTGDEQRPEPPGPQPLALAAERGLAEMGDLSREPREAIIACYAAMEHALANAPDVVPQDSDTPSEVLARAVDHHAIHAESASELVALFAEARFSPHVMSEEHREIAVRALELVLEELRSPA